MKKQFLQSEEGYTLLETVVALALFLSVLIPLGAVIGNMFLDRRADLLRLSLQECQSEMTRIITEEDYSNGTKSLNSQMSLERIISRSGDLIEVDIVSRVPERTILKLQKTIHVNQ